MNFEYTSDKLNTPEETAEQLTIQVKTLAQWRSNRQNSLKWVKVGRLVRYRQSDIEAFIASRVVGGES